MPFAYCGQIDGRRIVVDDDGTIMEVSRETWAAMEALAGFELQDMREWVRRTRHAKRLPPPVEEADADD